jgi:uncharacterized protein (DUF1330 family)
VKTRYAVTFATIAGFGFGVLTAQGLYAESTPHAFVITLFDAGEMISSSYPSLAPATFQPFGGRYIIHSGRTITFDGEPPKQIVAVAFDSMEKALAWHNSDAFKAMYDMHKITNVRAFAVEGVAR